MALTHAVAQVANLGTQFVAQSKGRLPLPPLPPLPATNHSPLATNSLGEGDSSGRAQNSDYGSSSMPFDQLARSWRDCLQRAKRREEAKWVGVLFAEPSTAPR